MSRTLTHLDDEGRARMVNVGEKAVTERVCVARGAVRMARDTLFEPIGIPDSHSRFDYLIWFSS